jgi:hypothetical protein
MVQLHRLAAERDRHLTIEDPFGHRDWKLFPDDRFERVALRDDDGAVLLQHLRPR